jgi:hypothetical protein
MNARLNLPNNSPLSAELEFRQRLGQKRVTIREFEARRDANFRALQKLRGEIFAVTRGAIFEL